MSPAGLPHEFPNLSRMPEPAYSLAGGLAKPLGHTSALQPFRMGVNGIIRPRGIAVHRSQDRLGGPSISELWAARPVTEGADAAGRRRAI